MEEVATAPWWAWVIVVVFFGGIIGKVIYNRVTRKTGTGKPSGPRTPPGPKPHIP